MTFSINKLLRWLILTLLFPSVFLNGWLALRLFQYFQPLVTILVLAALLAFILNYPVSLLKQNGVKHSYAVALVFISTLLILLALGVTLFPIVLQQFNEIVKLLPQWIDSSDKQLQIFNDWALNQKLKLNLNEVSARIVDQLGHELDNLSDKLFSLVLDTIDSISEALITVVLTFYLLLDGERIWQALFKKLPSFGQHIQQSLQQNFQNYLIGQVALAFLVGVSQTLMLLLLKVPFGLLFGFAIGIMSLIPFGDILSLILITLITASHDFWLAVKLFAIAIVIDQLIDQAIAPRLLGKFTGIRPIWVILSLLVGTYIGSVLGLIIAVPVAGFIKDAVDGWTSISSYADSVVEVPEATDIITTQQ
jgi:predicted PurR-regulated permease PerM